MLVAQARVHCPLCGVDIPCPATAAPTPEGLSVDLDTTLVDEHAHMHETCPCIWANGRVVAFDTRCETHHG